MFLVMASAVGQQAQPPSSGKAAQTPPLATAAGLPCAPDSRPFLLRASFTYQNAEHQHESGKLTLLWASPDQWRREIQSNLLPSRTETRDGEKAYGPNSAVPLRVRWLYDNLLPNCRQTPTPKAVGGPLERASDAPDPTASIASNFGSNQPGHAEAASRSLEQIGANSFSRYEPFRNLSVAREGVRMVDGRVAETFTITELQDSPPVAESSFILDIEPTVYDGLEHTLKDARARKSAEPEFNLTGRPQNAALLISLTVARDGTVRSEKITRSSGSAEIDKAVLAAFAKMLFDPATRDGVPVESIVVLTFSVTALR